MKNSDIQLFNQLLSELYGQDVAVQIQPSPSLQVKSEEMTEREKTLLHWVFEYMQKQSDVAIDTTVTSLPVMLQMLWKMAEQSVHEHEHRTLSEFDPFEHIQDMMNRIPLPLVCVYLDIGTQQNVEQLDMDYYEMIKELASGYAKRSILTTITSTQLGILIPCKDGTDFRQALDEIIEECHSWVDALLAEVFVEAKVGISTFVTSHIQLVKGMADAIHANKIGCLNGSKYGVFAQSKLGVQRILANLNAEEREQYRESILSYKCYKALGQELRDTALAFFRNHLNISETARVLYMHRNSLLYRLDKIRDLSGYDIRKFEDAVTFWTALMLWKIDEIL